MDRQRSLDRISKAFTVLDELAAIPKFHREMTPEDFSKLFKWIDAQSVIYAIHKGLLDRFDEAITVNWRVIEKMNSKELINVVHDLKFILYQTELILDHAYRNEAISVPRPNKMMGIARYFGLYENEIDWHNLPFSD
jgi:hypothetical protein